MAHRHCARALLSTADNSSAKTVTSSATSPSRTIHNSADSGSLLSMDMRSPTDEHERKLLGRAHLREALVHHEEAERLVRMCRELKGKKALKVVLVESHQDAIETYAGSEKEDDFRELLDAPLIQSK